MFSPHGAANACRHLPSCGSGRPKSDYNVLARQPDESGARSNAGGTIVQTVPKPEAEIEVVPKQVNSSGTYLTDKPKEGVGRVDRA
jgi:hypothetical protein